MKILAIETSCDETAIAVIEASGSLVNPKFKILSNIVASQIKIHAKWGGVVPNLAKREHLKNLPLVLRKALLEAGIKKSAQGRPASGWESVDVIAVTTGPGLEPALWTGINFVEELAKKWKKPVIAVNHMEGHIVASLLKQDVKKIKFPALALLVSGGHTEIILINKWCDYKIIGETLDDAAGEAFDKIAKMLGLPYPGGPVVAKLASEHIPDPILLKQFPKIIFPRPMIHSKNYNFSFSGLKTSVLYFIKSVREEKSFGLSDFPSVTGSRDQKLFSNRLIKAICYEAQQAIIDTLVYKTVKATKELGVKSIILGGGVAANTELRKQLGEKIKNELPKINYVLPEISLTGDNAAMVGATAYLRALKKQFTKLEDLKAEGNMALK
jgi:N6-L-threonylcarbamoyladenine synthase